MKPVIRDEAIVNAVNLTADDVVHCRVLCPACGSFTFDRWPEGWDGHSGYKCEALQQATPEERKAAFKEKFSYLFR